MRFALVAALTFFGCGDEPAGVRYEIPHRPRVACDDVEVGGTCARDADCDRSAVCAREPSAPPQDLASATLACQAPGTGGAPGTGCASALGCVHGLCVAAGTCVAPCVDDSDCGVGSRCQSVWVRAGPEAFERARGCVPLVSAPSDVVAVSHEIDAIEWSRGRARLDIAPGPSHLVVIPGCRASALATSLATRDPDPVVRFDYGEAVGGAAQLTWIEEGANPIDVLTPNGAAPPSPRGLTLSLQTEGEGGAEVVELTRADPGRMIDVDLFYLGAEDWAPAGERGPPRVEAALDYLDSQLGPLGLALGEVRQHEIRGGLRSRFAVVSTGLRPTEEDERGALFALSAGARGPSIPIFLVRVVVGALGRSGGVPGPAGIHGTAGSGVVLGPDLVSSQSIFQRALAHETLHFLGLFHTTEATGLVKDTIADTPVCGLERDADGDGLLSAEECEGAGADNLMFWAAVGEALTDGQADVVSRTLVAR